MSGAVHANCCLSRGSRLPVRVKQWRVLAFAVCLLTGCQQQTAPEGLVLASTIRAHMEFLADDLLEGREAGHRGFDVAAEYVAAQYRAIGLRAFDEDFYQEMTLRRAVPGARELNLSVGEQQLELEPEDFLLNGHPEQGDVALTREIVFVGSGVQADTVRDDYDGLNAVDKVVAYIDDVPADLSESVRPLFLYTDERWRTAAVSGAQGALTLMVTDEDEPRSWSTRRAAAEDGSYHWIDTDGTSGAARLGVTGTLSPSGTAKLLALAGFPSVGPSTATTQETSVVTAEFRLRTQHEDLPTRNVIGILPGSGPRRDEFVVYTAHLDHVGIGPPVGGDAIYNGAVDNASGVATMLAIAQAFATHPPNSGRSLLFLATTAEEPGLIGADYFVRRGPIPVENIVAAINIDGATLMAHPLLDVNAMGSADSSMGAAVRAAADRVGLGIAAEPSLPLLGSDHFPFARAGVPALWVIAGTATGRDDLNGRQLQKAYMTTRYHSPQDDLSQPLDFEAAAILGHLLLETGWEIATAPGRPMWQRTAVALVLGVAQE